MGEQAGSLKLKRTPPPTSSKAAATHTYTEAAVLLPTTVCCPETGVRFQIGGGTG